MRPSHNVMRRQTIRGGRPKGSFEQGYTRNSLGDVYSCRPRSTSLTRRIGSGDFIGHRFPEQPIKRLQRLAIAYPAPGSVGH
jgi:hypothetical protein